MPRLGVPVTTAPWEAPADDDPQAHWLAGVRPRKLRSWLRHPSDRELYRPGPRHGTYQLDRDGRERCISAPWGF